jgi:hypothetical protein
VPPDLRPLLPTARRPLPPLLCFPPLHTTIWRGNLVCARSVRDLDTPSPPGYDPVQRRDARLVRLGERDKPVVSRGDAGPVGRPKRGLFCKILSHKRGQIDALYMP